MINYITINDKQISLTEEQAEAILSAIREMGSAAKNEVLLSDVPSGELFRIGEYEFVVLEQMEGKTAVILKDLLKEEMTFGSSNHYKDSNVDKACREFSPLVAAIVGDENLLGHTVDLTSDDGLKNYGVITRRVSLLTTDLYRRYVEILDKFKPDAWWWLATPFSTKRHDNDLWVKCVSPSGYIDINHYDYYGHGVRPFCILKSDIFVSR